jgi:hypothetical protein
VRVPEPVNSVISDLEIVVSRFGHFAPFKCTPALAGSTTFHIALILYVVLRYSTFFYRPICFCFLGRSLWSALALSNSPTAFAGCPESSELSSGGQ